MVQPHYGSNREQVVDTMIELTRLSKLHRTIVAGSDSLELYLALRRRGFIRVATAATCRNIYSTYAQPKSLLLLNSQLACACCRLLLRQEPCDRSSQAGTQFALWHWPFWFCSQALESRE
jgi:hypothetical protein